MLEIINGAYFAGGLVAATVVWYFVLRNNKKNFSVWMDGTEQYFMDALGKIDGISDEASAKIDELFAEFKKGK